MPFHSFVYFSIKPKANNFRIRSAAAPPPFLKYIMLRGSVSTHTQRQSACVAQGPCSQGTPISQVRTTSTFILLGRNEM